MTKKKKSFPPQVPTVTQPHLESYVYAFLQSRGFDLYPRIRDTKDGYAIALYFDRDKKGWWKTFELELDGKKSPAHFMLSVALANHLYTSGVQPRSPAPLGELECRALRNAILGQLQDGINSETAVQLLNTIAGTMTRHLRPNNMRIDFGDGEDEQESVGDPAADDEDKGEPDENEGPAEAEDTPEE